MNDPAARDKAAARARLRAVRAALTAEAASGEAGPDTPVDEQTGARPGKRRDAQIGAQLDALIARCAPRCIGFYWPLRGEFDARALIAAWLAQEPARRAALPVIRARADEKRLSAQREAGTDRLLSATAEASTQTFTAPESQARAGSSHGLQTRGISSQGSRARTCSARESSARMFAAHASQAQVFVTHESQISPPEAQTVPPFPAELERTAPDAPAGRRARIQPVPLEFHRWTPGAPMRAGAHGIAEPASDERLAPDLLLIPCVGFDAHGYRLGYGGGYYDRTLAAWPGDAKPLTIGLAWEACRLDALPREAHDVPLDAIVTDAGCYLHDGFRQRMAGSGPARGG